MIKEPVMVRDRMCCLLSDEFAMDDCVRWILISWVISVFILFFKYILLLSVLCSTIVCVSLYLDYDLFNASARHLLNDLGRRSSLNSGEARETSFLYQRISILVQRFNAVLLHDSLPAVDSMDWRSYPLFSFNFLLPWDYIYPGQNNNNNINNITLSGNGL